MQRNGEHFFFMKMIFILVRTSPKRKPQSQTPMIENTNTGQDFESLSESNLASIKFLLMENSRLRCSDHSRLAFDLFHPSDPLMKRVVKVNDDEIKEVHIDALANVSNLKSSSLRLRQELEHFLSTAALVNISKDTLTKEKDIYPRKLSPINQWQFQNRYFTHLYSCYSKIQDHTSFSLYDTTDSINIGHLTMQKQKDDVNPTEIKKILFSNHQDFIKLHQSLIKI
jgi:hypothetical protein